MSFNLYQENILDHYEHPYNHGIMEHPTLEYRDLNPLCGDEVRVQGRLDEQGRLAEVKKMDRQMMLDLLGIPLTAMRVKCAMLALRTLEKAIHLYESGKGETAVSDE